MPNYELSRTQSINSSTCRFFLASFLKIAAAVIVLNGICALTLFFSSVPQNRLKANNSQDLASQLMSPKYALTISVSFLCNTAFMD